jgi:RNA polymerase sigma-70 factor (ECF subfamily)
MISRAGCRLTEEMTGSGSGGHGQIDEWALVDAACGGDERAFGVLIERYRPGLEQACGLMLGDPERSERVVREAVLTAWRECRLASDCSSVRMWLYRIIVRKCMEASSAGDEFLRHQPLDG